MMALTMTWCMLTRTNHAAMNQPKAALSAPASHRRVPSVEVALTCRDRTCAMVRAKPTVAHPLATRGETRAGAGLLLVRGPPCPETLTAYQRTRGAAAAS